MSLDEDELALKHLVLLPGLDGTGQLFTEFLTALPHTLTATVVAYPTKRFLTYSELLQLVGAAVPKTEPFLLLAESYSTPIALKYAATKPSNLAAVILCAGFISTPIASWSPLVKIVAKPWIFRLRPPRFVLEYFLIGQNAPPPLIQTLRQTLQLVHPEVLSDRVREVLNCDVRIDLARTTVPIMYVRASQDRLLAASCHQEILRIRPDIVLEEIEAPHMLLQREPERGANLIAAFMARS
jgi:pimeloyl-[acyl-carrier protein] methyl ester esterase